MDARKVVKQGECTDCGLVVSTREGHETRSGRFFCRGCHAAFMDRREQLATLGKGASKRGCCNTCGWVGIIFVAKPNTLELRPNVPKVMCSRCWDQALKGKRQKLAIAHLSPSSDFCFQKVLADTPSTVCGVPVVPSPARQQEFEDDADDLEWLSDKFKDPGLAAVAASFRKRDRQMAFGMNLLMGMASCSLVGYNNTYHV